MSKTRCGKAVVVKEYESGIRLLNLNGKEYTAYGRMFAVEGNQVEAPYNDIFKMKHYEFKDWNELTGIFCFEE